MTKEQIYAEAVEVLRTRRRNAQQEQEQRTDRIRREIPETAELDRQLRAVCGSILSAIGRPDNKERLKQIEQHTKAADAMLRDLLTAKGYPADYLDVHYTCQRCDDTGFVGGRPCVCLKQEIGRISAEQFNVRSQLVLCSFADFSLDYYRDLPPEQFHAMEQNLAVCKAYADSFSPERSGSLLMSGNTGLGKTHLSLAIANALLQRGVHVIYDSIGSLLHILEQEHFGRGDSDSDTLSTMLDCDLLILDDFGTEFRTSFSRSMIYTILNSRMNAGKPMIVNTNLTLGEIREEYGDRVVSRLISASQMLAFYGRDIRIQKSLRRSAGQGG